MSYGAGSQGLLKNLYTEGSVGISEQQGGIGAPRHMHPAMLDEEALRGAEGSLKGPEPASDKLVT